MTCFKTTVWAALCCAAFGVQAALPLDGVWHVKGVSPECAFEADARLPGTLYDAHLGEKQTYDTWNKVADKAARYTLRPAFRFVGKATWSRRVNVPADLAAKPLELFLERVLWVSTLKVDGKTIGSRDSLGTPHVYAFAPGALAPGEHLFEIEIDNTCHYGFTGWAHSWGPATQTRWNGVIGAFELREANPLRGARVFAKWPAQGAFEIALPPGAALADVRVSGLDGVKWTRAGDRVKVTFAGEPVYWNEYHPRRYALTLSDGKGFSREMKFAFRTFARDGKRILLNGVPFWQRGDVDNCQFPLTGYPPTTPAEWRRQIRIQQLNGCNAMRSHTWTPPEAAFEAADELGFCWMVECSYWADGWMKGQGIGGGTPELDAFLHAELLRICDVYGDHPSLLSVSMGNELGSSDFAIMDGWMREAKAHDGRFLTMASSARKVCPSDDYMTTHNYPGIGSVRCWRRNHTDWDYEEAYAKAPIPVVAHEIGQWPVYPYWDEMAHFTGHLRPFDWEWMRSLAVSNGTLKMMRRWHVASMKSSRWMYKDEVESFLRTPSCAGLQLLDVRDYTGQGEALVGWLDADFKAKPGVSEVPPFSAVFRDVPFLARFAKCTWRVGETYEAKLEVRNLTDRPLPAGTRWPWSFAGKRGWAALEKDLPPYEIARVAVVRVPLEAWAANTKQTLRFGENEWNGWVFPAEEPAPVPPNVTLATTPEAALAALAKGARVLYRGTSRTTGKGHFQPVYWSTIHFPSKDPSAALGTWFDEDHPALAGFPTEDWMDAQWRSLAEGAVVHVLRGMPADFEAIAAPVSDFHFSENLATLFELRVGAGRLFVCGYDLDAQTPEATALRRSVFAYVGGDAFRPKTEVTPEALARLLLPDPKQVREVPMDKLKITRDATTFRMVLVGAEPVQGKFVVKFFATADLAGTFEDRPCTRETGVDGETRLVAQMNREDALDGKFNFTCKANKGIVPRFAGVEIVPE